VSEYDHKKIEKKWQEAWAKNEIYKTADKSSKPKYYILDMFPYPSGSGLHVGHPKGYIASDILSRFYRMSGFNVLHPMGWDAFGLPAENYALKTKTHPKVSTDKNVQVFKKQIGIIGLDYDWGREINTTDPEYYKWTQWIFLKLFEKGLAYESNEPINWCPSCKTGLANEDLENGKCERCGSDIEKKPMRQWVLKIREYADRLLNDIDQLDWPESIKELQKNWIGRSEGAQISFKIKDGQDKIDVFTTRVDTLLGATYVVLSPEHPLVAKLSAQAKNKNEIEKYVRAAANKTDAERLIENKDKTGVKIDGVLAINPSNDEAIPVFIADYVLAQYGTGAVMAVPAHDLRDFDFAKKYSIPIKKVIAPAGEKQNNEECFVEDGVLINSGQFTGLSSSEARKKITKFCGGKLTTNYKLRDWVFSRQRYWGEPIPIIHCQKCGVAPVPEKDLPVLLPEVASYEPTGTGESPLAGIDEWVNTTCPKCGGKAKRETNTMPQWAGSSWYYLRYIDPKNAKALVDEKKEKYWSPVDMYIGGAEHATRHLIYARFWHKFLKDIGVVSYDEPFKKLQHVGLINGEDGRKMGKRWGNVVNPDDIVATYGADTLRLFEMFLGPFDKSANWNTAGIIGPRRFLERVWKMSGVVTKETGEENARIESLYHATLKKVGNDIRTLNFNTAISEMMIFVNKVEEIGKISKTIYMEFLQILAPFAPHMTEELWHQLGQKKSIHLSDWPKYDEKKIVSELKKIAVQVNGRVRGEIKLEQNCDGKITQKMVLEMPEIQKWVPDGKFKKFIYIEGKIINIVVN